MGSLFSYLLPHLHPSKPSIGSLTPAPSCRPPQKARSRTQAFAPIPTPSSDPSDREEAAEVPPLPPPSFLLLLSGPANCKTELILTDNLKQIPELCVHSSRCRDTRSQIPVVPRGAWKGKQGRGWTASGGSLSWFQPERRCWGAGTAETPQPSSCTITTDLPGQVGFATDHPGDVPRCPHPRPHQGLL